MNRGGFTRLPAHAVCLTAALLLSRGAAAQEPSPPQAESEPVNEEATAEDTDPLRPSGVEDHPNALLEEMAKFRAELEQIKTNTERRESAAQLDVEEGDSGSGIFEDIAQKVALHGYGTWSAGYTDNANRYRHLAQRRGNWHHLDFALVPLATPVEQLLITGQIFGEIEEGEAEFHIDYSFAQWTFDETFKLKVGKSKQPFGIYSQIFDVGTLRPFIALPQGIYGPAALNAESYTGIGIQGNYEFGDWGVSYDLYFGSLHLPVEEPYEVLLEEGTGGGEEHDGEDLEHAIGAKLTIDTPLDGLSVGVAGFSGEEGAARDHRHSVIGTHFEYMTGDLTLRVEYAHLFQGESADAFYVEASYMFFEHLQLAVRYDFAELTLEGERAKAVEETPSLTEHSEVGVALNYWFNSQFVLKASYHYVKGNRFSHPLEEKLPARVESETLSDETHVLLFGASFTF